MDRRECPCTPGVSPDFREPVSIEEVYAAFWDGEPVHDDDGDCIVVMFDRNTVDEAGKSKIADEDYWDIDDDWWTTHIAYKVGYGDPDTYFRPYHSLYVPVHYEMLPPVTPEEEASAIASILGVKS